MSLCMPDVLVDALLQKLSQERIASDRTTAARDRRRVQDVITDVALPVIGELGRAELSVSQVRALRRNDIVKLATLVGQDVGVFVGDQLLYRARVGQRKRRMALRVSEKLEVPEPFAAVLREVEQEVRAANAPDAGK